MQPLFNFVGSSAPLSVLAFLGTAAALAALAVAAVILLARRNRFAAGRVAMAGGGIAAAYVAALAAFSLASGARQVEPGNAKYFCELDCHLAYAVVGSRRVGSLGGTPADGAFEVVTLKVWFDPGTTSPRRGDAPLTPNPRAARLVDAAGRSYAPSAEGLRALETEWGAQAPLSRALRPGESYTTSLVFEVPAAMRAPELLLTEADPVTRLLIGHENSFLHRPVPFRLADSSPSPAVRG
ncbi:hypothetical protein [Longimicrobium sp.]|uniref:hypothetical protein n=1 Tax=Longimicrobium sp. TaxID=2029185 RepID=UPI002CCE70DF|nr:hypothetical protein [Longimicrobium sp.]HSU13891.1 hypothetical protein [Longimicrobium sp.]